MGCTGPLRWGSSSALLVFCLCCWVGERRGAERWTFAWAMAQGWPVMFWHPSIPAWAFLPAASRDMDSVLQNILCPHAHRQCWPVEQSISVIGKVASVLDAVQHTKSDALESLQIEIKRKQLRSWKDWMFCFLFFLIDSINLLLEGITARMIHWQREGKGTVEKRVSPLPVTARGKPWRLSDGGRAGPEEQRVQRAEEMVSAEVSRGLCPSSRVLQESLNDGEWYSLVMVLSTERTCNRVLSLGRTQAVLQLPGGLPDPPEARGPTSWARLRAQVESRGCSLQRGRSQVPGGTHHSGPTSDSVPRPQQPRGESRACLEGQELVGF